MNGVLTVTQRFNIEEVPMLRLFVATDSQFRLRLSADIIDLYKLDAGNRVSLGYDSNEHAIAIKPAASAADPTAANVDKRGYISARRFYDKTKLDAVARRYSFAGKEGDWLVFIAE